MMQRRSPPNHRHDGTSPLPLGMDWSPPPRKWNGKETVWPHDPRTGWSYSVAIPSWVVLPKSRDSDPVVFYRVQIGLQSPESVTSTLVVLRRFNDFLKLFTELKAAFPKKSVPPAPPKGLLRMKSRVLLEERRCSLEEWMTKLLSDIDLSRSVTVASFLELEAAARSAFQEENECSPEPNVAGHNTVLSNGVPTSSNTFHVAGSSITSDYGSDTAYETSELGSPRLGRDDYSDIGFGDLPLDEDLSGSIEKFVKGMSNIDEGLVMGQTILEQLEDFPRHTTHSRNINNTTEIETYNGNGSRASFLGGNGLELFSDPEPAKMVGHAQKLSTESVGSDIISLRGSDMGNSRIPNSSVDLPGTSKVSSTMVTHGNLDSLFSGGTQIFLPLDQRQKLNRVLLTMQQRLGTAKTDMEDLIARLNQEIAVKGYLTTKVNDLEVELESTKQKSRENLQQAILIERERFTQMQWEMEELRRKSLEMELKSNPKQDEMQITETSDRFATEEKDAMLQELNATKEQLNIISKQYEELETKSKADIKLLVKEVKSLRKSEKQLKQEVGQSLLKISDVEVQLEHERQTSKHVKTARENLLNQCRLLHNSLLECNVSLSTDDDENLIKDSSLIEEALDLLTTSDDKITLLLAEVQLLAKEDATIIEDVNNVHKHDSHYDCRIDDELRKIIADIFTDNAKLRKQVNSQLRNRCEFEYDIMSKNNEELNRS
ncbi:Adenine phosphoribosyltransferase 5 isoform 1 [Hibiscus syriacus]|uniref:Adenine phosphoribosyltransferase 5 isoform 1 n=1 Tax=Hibiscus syriacus TaxID=106335 RepID=A0A6A2WEN4_HIBSY|nr:PX domain-containing protein EREL1-like isoform X2 [Hibiscus syriacus]KAE8654555.1 Adenine phosphoribosyltransferase 5 isoform 1 [Hibiscus syriacus]